MNVGSKMYSYPSGYPMTMVANMWETGAFEPNDDSEYWWSHEQASLFIDSFLSGIPIPPLYLWETGDDKYAIAKGLQRIVSIYRFMTEAQKGSTSEGLGFKLTGKGIPSARKGLCIDEVLDGCPPMYRFLRSAPVNVVIFPYSPSRDSIITFAQLQNRLGCSRLHGEHVKGGW